MAAIEKNDSPNSEDVESFLKLIDFILPKGFMEFFKEANGAEIYSDECIVILWPLTEMIPLNAEYNVETFAPGFFIFGSDGGGMAYAIEKSTGSIFEFPFIGMCKNEAVLKNETFNGFMLSLIKER